MGHYDECRPGYCSVCGQTNGNCSHTREKDSDDLSDIYRSFKEHKKEQHSVWHEDNLKALFASGYRFSLKNRGQTCVFRNEHYPRVDFFPSTGRWRAIDEKKTYRGGALRFLDWYSKGWDRQ